MHANFLKFLILNNNININNIFLIYLEYISLNFFETFFHKTK